MKNMPIEMNAIAISSDTLTGCLATMMELDLEYPIVSDYNKNIIHNLALEDPYSLKSLPAMFILDKDMKVIWSHIGIDRNDKPNVIEGFKIIKNNK